MTEPDAFDQADFYGSEDEELLSYEDPEEYIACRASDWWDPRDGAIVVVAYKRRVVGLGHMRRWAMDATERISELYYEDEFCNPEENDFADAEGPLQRAIEAAIARVLRDHVVVWGCEKVASREYSPTEVGAILVDHGMADP